MDRDGNGRVFRPFAMPQVSEQLRVELPGLDLTGCNRCSRSSYLDREGFNEARNLHCPMEGCNYIWCKECQQEFVPNGPKHSCDGSSELKRLVEQQGWKYCPGKTHFF